MKLLCKYSMRLVDSLDNSEVILDEVASIEAPDDLARVDFLEFAYKYYYSMILNLENDCHGDYDIYNLTIDEVIYLPELIYKFDSKKL